MGVWDKLKHAWNVFSTNETESPIPYFGPSASYSHRPDRPRTTYSTERSMLASILTRLAIDVAAVDIRHVRTDDEGRYEEDMKSGLNECLKVQANVDQAARHFRQNIVSVMLDKGVVAIVPVDATIDPAVSSSYEINTMRVGEIVSWHPQHVRVKLYNEQTGHLEDVTVLKRTVAIVENPLYNVMNEPNSTLQRLIRKLNMLDAVDEQTSSGKLDLIIQLPYVIKSEARKQQAEQRRNDIEVQLKGSKYGIAYTDGTEKITQLNRPAENQLLKQVEYLTQMLYSQLGLTEAIMNGTADEATMLNYINRTIDPLLGAITEAMARVFLTKTARSQNQAIMYFRNPFKLVPVGQIADIADKLSRNKILAPNEIRQIIGFKPSKDPEADKLQNANMPDPNPAPPDNQPPDPTKQLIQTGGSRQNGSS
jgi:hypothetical protein